MERKNILLLGRGDPAVRLAQAIDAPMLDVDRDDLAAALAEASRRPIDLILIAICAEASLRARAFETLRDEDWREGVDRSLEALLHTLQCLGAHYPTSPPPIVLAGPSMALSGGDELAMLAASFEGQRALMKSAARQWGSRGFRFTWIAIDTSLFAPELEGAPLPRAQDPEPLATGAPTHAQLAATLSWLSDSRARGITGQSLVLDGGELMLP